MAIICVIGTKIDIEELITTISRPLYLTAFKARFPDSQTRLALNYYDKVTNEINDTVIQLDVSGLIDHADRLDIPIQHPNITIDKALVYFEDTKIGDDLNIAYYYNSTARLANGANPALTNYTRLEAQAQGFFPGAEI